MSLLSGLGTFVPSTRGGLWTVNATHNSASSSTACSVTRVQRSARELQGSGAEGAGCEAPHWCTAFAVVRRVKSRLLERLLPRRPQSCRSRTETEKQNASVLQAASYRSRRARARIVPTPLRAARLAGRFRWAVHILAPVKLSLVPDHQARLSWSDPQVKLLSWSLTLVWTYGTHPRCRTRPLTSRRSADCLRKVCRQMQPMVQLERLFINLCLRDNHDTGGDDRPACFKLLRDAGANLEASSGYADTTSL